MAAFVGNWKLLESENFDDFMKAIGVGFVTRKLANSVKPSLEVTLDGSVMNIKTISAIRTLELKFTVGEEFDETTPDGASVKSLVTNESDTKMVQTQKGTIDRTITREIIDDVLLVTYEAKGVVSKRKYIRE